MPDRLSWLDTNLGDTADGLYIVDERHRIVRWNRGAERLLGHRAKEVVNRHCHEVVGACRPDGGQVCAAHCAVHRTIERGELPDSLEVHVSTKDGRRIWLHVSLLVIARKPGPLVVHVLHDVSEGRRAADAMLRVASVLEANRALGAPNEATPRDLRREEASPPPGTPTVAFTEREREVLHCLAAGLSNETIATKLGVSRYTIRSHVQHILTKAGVHNRSQAVAFAFRNRLL